MTWFLTVEANKCQLNMIVYFKWGVLCKQYLKDSLKLKNQFGLCAQCLKPSSVRCNAECSQLMTSLAASMPQLSIEHCFTDSIIIRNGEFTKQMMTSRLIGPLMLTVKSVNNKTSNMHVMCSSRYTDLLWVWSMHHSWYLLKQRCV